MKAEHRHELKTNELAEWLSNFPEWARENCKSIVAITAIIVIAIGFYAWRRYDRNVVQTREQVEFTNLLGEIPQIEMQIVTKQYQGTDVSHFLLPQADNLKNYAAVARTKNMAALALIKEADALRAELHYRFGTVSQQDLTDQITRAKASYTEAIQKASSNPSLVAAAKFGLGLCAEELGDFTEAKRIYQEIASNPDFEGMVAIFQARNRLETMSEYENQIVFKPAPVKKPAAATQPMVQIQPVDANRPMDVNMPFGITLPGEVNKPADVNMPVDINMPTDTNLPIEITLPVDVNIIQQKPADIPQVTGVNVPPVPPDSLKDSDVNVPGE